MPDQSVEASVTKKRALHRMNGDHSIRMQKKEISKIEEASIEFPTLHATTMAIILRWKGKLDGEAKIFPLIISTENFSDKYRCSPESVKIFFIGKAEQLRQKKETAIFAKLFKDADKDFVVLGRAGNKTFSSKICSIRNLMKNRVRKDEIEEYYTNE